MTKSGKHHYRSQKENSSANNNSNNESSAGGLKEFKKKKQHPPKRDGKSAKGSLRISAEKQGDIVVYKRTDPSATRAEEFEKNPSAPYSDETTPQEYNLYVRRFRGIEHVTQKEITKRFQRSHRPNRRDTGRFPPSAEDFLGRQEVKTGTVSAHSD